METQRIAAKVQRTTWRKRRLIDKNMCFYSFYISQSCFFQFVLAFPKKNLKNCIVIDKNYKNTCVYLPGACFFQLFLVLLQHSLGFHLAPQASPLIFDGDAWGERWKTRELLQKYKRKTEKNRRRIDTSMCFYSLYLSHSCFSIFSWKWKGKIEKQDRDR